jgi:uncharacterized coiled-coil protein SlyX
MTENQLRILELEKQLAAREKTIESQAKELESAHGKAWEMVANTPCASHNEKELKLEMQLTEAKRQLAAREKTIIEQGKELDLYSSQIQELIEKGLKLIKEHE